MVILDAEVLISKIINGFYLEIPDLQVILSPFPLLKLKTFLISHSINECGPLTLSENNKLNIPPQT